MKVTVRLFAGLRERAGAAERELELPNESKAKDAWRELGLGDQPPGLLLAVNRQYVDQSHVLSEGDEVAFIPPLGGG